MKRNDFLKTLAALVVSPKLVTIERKSIRKNIKFTPMKEESYDGGRINISMMDEAGQCSYTAKEVLELFKRTGNLIYRRV